MVPLAEAPWQRIAAVGRVIALILIAGIAFGLSLVTLFATLGWMPWPELALSMNGVPLPDAGIWAQVGLTLFFILLCFFLPTNLRMQRLELAHRNFAVGMEDVARAYRIAHAADRTGVFTLGGEFESMRERMEHLRRHPDLGHLEPELLQLAAEMSHETRALARTYSEAKVARARDFLRQRQEEIESLQERLKLARMTCDELRRWHQDISVDEIQAQNQLRRLEADLKEILPGLGYAVDIEERVDGNVVNLPRPAAIPVRPDRPEPRV